MEGTLVTMTTAFMNYLTKIDVPLLWGFNTKCRRDKLIMIFIH